MLQLLLHRKTVGRERGPKVREGGCRRLSARRALLESRFVVVPPPVFPKDLAFYCLLRARAGPREPGAVVAAVQG